MLHPPHKSKGAYIRGLTWIRAIATLSFLYLGSLACICCLVWHLPAKQTLLSPGDAGSSTEKLLLKVPASFSELHAVRHTLELYRRACPGKVALLLLSIYIFCQVFMMPGSSFLNLLSGSLYGTAAALPLIALLSTVGASGSYWLSRLVVKDVVVGLFPARVAAFSRAVAAQRPQLVVYLTAARVTPVIPSWFINLASPILQIPFRQFLVSTAIGLQPSNIIFVHAGASLGTLRSWRDLYGPRSVCLLLLCSVLALLPVLIRRLWPKMRPPALLPTLSSLQAVHVSPEPTLVPSPIASPRRSLVSVRLPGSLEAFSRTAKLDTWTK